MWARRTPPHRASPSSYARFLKRLIIRPGAIGDFIVSIPAIECLRTAYLEIWTAGRNVPLARVLADRARSIADTVSICWN